MPATGHLENEQRSRRAGVSRVGSLVSVGLEIGRRPCPLPPPTIADSVGTPARHRRSCGGRGVPLPALASVRAAAAARLGWRGRSRAGAAQQVPRLPPPRRGERGRAGAGGGGRFGDPRARPAPQAGCELAASGSAPSLWRISQPAAAGDPGTTRIGVRRAPSRDKGAGPARRLLSSSPAGSQQLRASELGGHPGRGADEPQRLRTRPASAGRPSGAAAPRARVCAGDMGTA